MEPLCQKVSKSEEPNQGTGLNKYAQGGDFSKNNNHIRQSAQSGLIVVQGGKVNVGQKLQLKLKE